jgi:hypothetical protein
MADMIVGVLGLAVVLGGIALGFWALRRQSRQYPKGTRTARDEERKRESRWSGMWHRGGQGGL